MIYLTDRRRLGAAVRLASRRGSCDALFGNPGATGQLRYARRFKSALEAESWWLGLPADCRLRRRFRMTPDRL